jgi:serine/threonine protein kinase
MTDVEGAPDASRTVWPLGKYLILAELGRGGMAEVYLALARGPSDFSKLVVLKLLRTHLAEDAEFLEMFLSEARLAARLNHPNVVQTYEVGVEGGRHCIGMEYLEGRSLAEVEAATRRAPMPLALAVRVLADTLAGLQYAHDVSDIDGRPLELVHRDVSPHNVFVTYDGQVKVLDFGIAKAADRGSRTKTGVFKGKIRYTAPERFTNEDTDRRSDLFSVGVMLWQVLTQKRLWSGLGDLAIMRELATGPTIPWPHETNPDVSPVLEKICMKALARAPADRFQTAAEFQDVLEEFLSSESVAGTNRALAKFMGEVFGETRARFQRAVDEQMRVAASAPMDDPTASVARLRAEGVPVLGFGPSTSESLSLGGIPVPSESASGLKRSGGIPFLSSNPPSVQSSAPQAQGSRRATVLAAFFGLLALAATVALMTTRIVRAPPEPKSVPSTAAAPMPAMQVPAAAVASTPAVHAPAAAAAPPDPLATSVDAGSVGRHVAPPVPLPSSPHVAAPTHGRSASPAAEPSRPAPPAPRSEPPKREVDCTSPYFVDDEGLKKIRPECL